MTNKTKPKKRKTKPKERDFKGCIKVGLDTSKPFEQLLAEARWYGDFTHRYRTILQNNTKRKWRVILYLTYLDGSKDMEIFKPNVKLHKDEFDDIINLALETVNNNPNVNRQLSYMTIGC